jgi:hypothetical protein
MVGFSLSKVPVLLHEHQTLMSLGNAVVSIKKIAEGVGGPSHKHVVTKKSLLFGLFTAHTQFEASIWGTEDEINSS